MSLRENSQEIHALFPYGRLVGGVGGVNAGEKSLELVRFKSPSNGFEFRRRYRLSITVGELGKARKNPVLEIVSHYFRFFFGSGFARITSLAVEPPGSPATLPEIMVLRIS